MGENDGHRKRLDKKVSVFGLEMLEAHEQLEYLLFAVIPRGDTNRIAHRLLDRFMTISGVLNAPPEELEKIEGVGHRTALFLASLPPLLGIVERSTKENKPPRLFEWWEISEYLKTYFYGKLTETAYMISLNSAYRLLGISKISEGSHGETPIIVYNVVRQAIRDNATAVIVVHNHPCGNINPSFSDITLSKTLMDAFSVVGIELMDCVVVSGDECFSMREHGYIEPSIKKDSESDKNKKK